MTLLRPRHQQWKVWARAQTPTMKVWARAQTASGSSYYNLESGPGDNCYNNNNNNEVFKLVNINLHVHSLFSLIYDKNEMENSSKV